MFKKLVSNLLLYMEKRKKKKIIIYVSQSRMNCEFYGPVLLVCIYNKYGNIITHDYFYQLFSQYGEIVKILIFQKAKVWKTFIEFTDIYSARVAMQNMNNHVVFEDGSKMNIFSSKLKNINFQNFNSGGVNYQQLKAEQQEMQEDQCFEGIRTRSSTWQDQRTSIPIYESTFETSPQSNRSQCNNYSESRRSIDEWNETNFSTESIATFDLFDIDEQFRQIARQSQEYRELEQESLKASIRKKSKTMVTNPNQDQFVLQNSPSKVLFVRAIPQFYTNKSLYNIFDNFGKVCRIIYMHEKSSALVQYDCLESAILSKDQLNYAKPEIKIFYSHYETIFLKEQTDGEDRQQYKSVKSKSFNVNPPTETLYLTHTAPKYEPEIKNLCERIDCSLVNMQWKQNGKGNRWMCLLEFKNIDQSLKAMGFLQKTVMPNGKQIRLSFTRSKIIPNPSNKKYRALQ